MLFARTVIAFVLALVILLPSRAAAQETLKAQVYDSLGSEPVPFASVIVKGTKLGTTTSESGWFELKGITNKSVIVIASLGYYTREIRADKIMNGRIALLPRSTQLKTVEITGEPVQAIQEKTSTFYIDYDFYDNYILALAITGNKRYLQLIDAEGKVVTSRRVGRKCEKLSRDCIGNVHLITADSSYQVYYDYSRLQLQKPYPIATFASVLAPCISMHKGAYYFRQMEYRGLKCKYYCVKTSEPGKKHVFRIAADSSKITDFNAKYDLAYFLKVRRESKGLMYGEPISSLLQNMDKYREELELDFLESQWLSPVETELHNIGNRLYLFNFTDSVMESYYDHDSLERVVDFKLHRDKDCVHHIIKDEGMGTAYAVFMNKSTATLREIDLHTGEARGSYEIKGYPFPEKIKVRDGVLYFLYRDKGTEVPDKIHKMVLR